MEKGLLLRIVLMAFCVMSLVGCKEEEPTIVEEKGSVKSGYNHLNGYRNGFL